MIVVDASSIAKYILREENWEKIREYLSDEPYSLTLAIAEVSNAIWKHAVLYKAISNKEALIMFNALMKLVENVLIFEPFERYLQVGIEIALNESISIYDALYIAQAKKIGKFLTSDEKQYRIAKKIGIDAKYVD
ncbi:MAG: type II toxin-antitoxin system VapC family toxin [Candidatus Odinarchaeota archaeon]|nr:type II toxin-antitoxin system VapC family toxin [Candidatus Odinarchaeota archaeon]